jgi:putative transposase
MGEKKVRGRKRHLLVDTEGHLLGVLVEPADIADRDAAPWLVQAIARRWPDLQLVWADQAYTGDLADWLEDTYGWELVVVRRPPGTHGFTLLPRRWVVERTIAWLNRNRRLSKDYERTEAAMESWCYLASIALLLRRLRPSSRWEVRYARKSA